MQEDTVYTTDTEEALSKNNSEKILNYLTDILILYIYKWISKWK